MKNVRKCRRVHVHVHRTKNVYNRSVTYTPKNKIKCYATSRKYGTTCKITQ